MKFQLCRASCARFRFVTDFITSSRFIKKEYERRAELWLNTIQNQRHSTCHVIFDCEQDTRVSQLNPVERNRYRRAKSFYQSSIIGGPAVYGELQNYLFNNAAQIKLSKLSTPITQLINSSIQFGGNTLAKKRVLLLHNY